MGSNSNLRIAWLVPSIERGNYWQPILREFTKFFKHTIFYSGDLWPHFDATAPGASVVKVVGKMKFVAAQSDTGYSRGFIYASPKIVGHLLQFRPHVIFASGFSIWTVFALTLKPLGGWKVIIIYDGSSPNIDTQDAKLRLFSRRVMAKLADLLIPNTSAGQTYFTTVLGVEPHKIFMRPYLVPDAQVLLEGSKTKQISHLQVQHPVFLFTGKIVPRKGLQALLQACLSLKDQGYSNYTLLVVGNGRQQAELESFAKTHGLENQVIWTGWVEYSQLGAYFQIADVLIFPTLEDVWGMVVPEAMVFGKPILCSKWAGAVELVTDGENGYTIDPHQPQEMAEAMRRFIDQPDLVRSMGEKSQQMIAEHTPEAAAQFFAEIVTKVAERL